MTTARLVLVHGTRFSHTQWNAYEGEFPGCEVVTPDLPGHGTAVSQPFTTEAALDALDVAVGERREGVPVILAGHSLGGYMAMAYAGRHPDRLAGLVLMGSSAVPDGVGAAAYRGFARLIDRVGPERMGRLANRVIARLASPEALEGLLAGGAIYTATTDAWAAVMADCRPDLLRDVACPVLLLNGQFDQLGIHARRFVAAGRQIRVTVVPRATHLFPITHPTLVAEVLRDFVDEVVRADDSGAPTTT